MAPIWAAEVLRDRGGSLKSRQVYDLTKLATGDEDKAQDAWSRAIAQEMSRGETPGL